MEAAEFEIYIERLRVSLESFPEVVGLVTLGTTADANLRDEWSDHDFWVITEVGAPDFFLNDLSWLPDFHNIEITVCHGRNRRTLLYRNRHKIEFAVFDVSEVASQAKAERYRILIDRGEVAQLIESIHQNTLEEAKVRNDALENLCVLAWSACERYRRGEFLSASQYLNGFAVNQLLSFISAFDYEIGDHARDRLDPRRRLELRSPKLAAELRKMIHDPVPDAAVHLLDIAERDIKPKAPGLEWDKLTAVREWIRELE